MKKMISDGWHEIGKKAVYTENGIIIKAVKNDFSENAAVYKWDSFLNSYVRSMPCKYDTFRRGLIRGTHEIY